MVPLLHISIADIYQHAPKEKIPSDEKKKSKKNKKIAQPLQPLEKKRQKKRSKKRSEKKNSSTQATSSSTGQQKKIDRITPTSNFLNSVLPERSQLVLKNIQEEGEGQQQQQQPPPLHRRQQRERQNNISTSPVSCLPPLIKTIKKKFKKNVKQHSFNAAVYLKKIIENILREALEKKAVSG